MEHVVFFPSPDGAPMFRRVPTLEEAVRLVEHLRNVDGVTEVGVHALGAEVPLAFRTYYRVEVPSLVAAEPVTAEPAPADDAVETAAPAVTVVPEQVEPQQEAVPVLAEAGANGHSGDGVKSLGFFA